MLDMLNASELELPLQSLLQVLLEWLCVDTVICLLLRTKHGVQNWTACFDSSVRSFLTLAMEQHTSSCGHGLR